jgi:mycothiol synthase
MKNDINIAKQDMLIKKLDIPGLEWRGFQGEVDYPKMLAVIHGCALVDGIERAEQLEDITNNYAHLHHCDPYQDMLFAEVDGKVVGYTRCWWEVEGSGTWVGFQFGNVLPEWRHKGIGSILLKFTEQRLSHIARQLQKSGELPAEASCILDNFVSSSETDRMELIERRGYHAVRYAFDMVRPNLENIPDLPLPNGVEVREVRPEYLRLIWEASNEAFRDHWGYIPDPWESFESFVQSPDYDPSLWRVAWQEDQVVGMVLSFIDKDQNEKYGRKRGYTENICVRRPWRKQGVARALIAFSLKALKERGMTEAGLGVDAENISGALRLYKYMGYQVVKQGTIYRKQITFEHSDV